MKHQMTNEEIYTTLNLLTTAFDTETRYFPVKINFLIQKNKNILYSYAEEIEKNRLTILKEYGYIDDNGKPQIKEECIQQANKEFYDLFNIKQEIDIYTIDYNEIKDLEFTPSQMEALMFMIQEIEEE